MSISLRTRHIVVGGSLVLAIVGAGVGFATAANAATSSSGASLTAVHGSPALSNVQTGHATKVGHVDATDATGVTEAGGSSAAATTLTAVPGAVPTNIKSGHAVPLGPVTDTGRSGATTAGQ